MTKAALGYVFVDLAVPAAVDNDSRPVSMPSCCVASLGAFVLPRNQKESTLEGSYCGSPTLGSLCILFGRRHATCVGSAAYVQHCVIDAAAQLL